MSTNSSSLEITIIAFCTTLSRLTLTTRALPIWYRYMTELCRLVYVCGEDVNVQDNYMETHLYTGLFYDNSDSVGALLLAGADETITNDDGQTPVQLGCEVWPCKSVATVGREQ
jgi:hypothetical protein